MIGVLFYFLHHSPFPDCLLPAVCFNFQALSYWLIVVGPESFSCLELFISSYDLLWLQYVAIIGFLDNSWLKEGSYRKARAIFMQNSQHSVLDLFCLLNGAKTNLDIYLLACVSESIFSPKFVLPFETTSPNHCRVYIIKDLDFLAKRQL